MARANLTLADAGGSLLLTSGDYLLLNQVTESDFNMANTYLPWRGAVEPAEQSASGNELKLWRGAVEPAGATSGSDFYIALTRRTASQMRPKQRMQKPKASLRDL